MTGGLHRSQREHRRLRPIVRFYPLPHRGSRQKCWLCDIGLGDCPDRVDVGPTGNEHETDDFQVRQPFRKRHGRVKDPSLYAGYLRPRRTRAV